MNLELAKQRRSGEKKKCGIGNLAPLLVVIGVFWSFTWKADFTFGDQVLAYFHLPSWSNGDTGIHYTVFYATPLFFLALILSIKYPKAFLAKTSKYISILLLCFYFSFLFFGIIQ